VIAEAFGRQHGEAAFMLRFLLDDDTFRVVWPVLEGKYEGDEQNASFLRSARRQAATMLYHDVKASCVKARVMGARTAFFAHLEMNDGRVASELSGAEVARFPKLLGPAVMDAEVIE
jgi:hypothetical protein